MLLPFLLLTVKREGSSNKGMPLRSVDEILAQPTPTSPLTQSNPASAEKRCLAHATRLACQGYMSRAVGALMRPQAEAIPYADTVQRLRPSHPKRAEVVERCTEQTMIELVVQRPRKRGGSEAALKTVVGKERRPLGMDGGTCNACNF